MKHTREHSTKPTDIHQHLIVLYELTVALEAKTVIELGVNTGESTIAFLEAVEETDGILISVDQQDLPGTRPMLERYGLTKRWQFQLANDIAFGLTWPKGKFADIVFVDTSHRYDQTKREIEIYEPIVRPGGLMIFHDTVSCYDGVQKPINEFLETHPGWPYKNRTNCNGLGVIWKPL